jgi:inhibitor of KinA sporulation pathway (predicted exonuclease)
MDLEFLCDQYQVYEDVMIAICVLSTDDSYELVSFIQPDSDDFEVSDYCTELTGINKETLLNQPFFIDLYDELIENIAGEDEILVWGNMDLEAFYKASMEIAGELEFNIIDFQTEFMEYCDISFRPGLKKVYAALTGDESVVHHDVKNDTFMLKEIHRIFNADKKGAMRQVKNKIK